VLIATLKQLGLSENEAKVYLAALELGQATVQGLAKKSAVKRTTVYTALEGLKEKGLVSQTKKDKKTFFAAESPENLVRLSWQHYQQIKKSLPELKSIYNTSDTKPKVMFYEGREGYISVYENILKDEPKELLAIVSYDDFCRHLDYQYEQEWIERRIEKKITLRWLDFRTPKTEAMKKEGRKALREIRFLPKDFSFTSSMFIYENKLILMSGKQKEFMAVVIENTEFSQMFKQSFEMLWQQMD
jgi:sugar-specific transcriptional regulator TrmB